MSLDVSAGGAFIAGLLSFSSPCVLPLVPPYLAYMGGISAEQLRENGGARGHVLVAGFGFVAGFSTVFVALGATASWIGQAVSAHLGLLSYLAGALICLMGLHFLHVIRIPLLDRSARVGLAQKPAGPIGAYVIGLACWSPCVGPALTAILIIAGAKESVGEGAWLCSSIRSGSACPFSLRPALPAHSCVGARAFERGSA